MEDSNLFILLTNQKDKKVCVRISCITMITELEKKEDSQVFTAIRTDDGTTLTVKEHFEYVMPWLGIITNKTSKVA